LKGVNFSIISMFFFKVTFFNIFLYLFIFEKTQIQSAFQLEIVYLMMGHTLTYLTVFIFWQFNQNRHFFQVEIYSNMMINNFPCLGMCQIPFNSNFIFLLISSQRT
jgi:hypothetical protein